MIYVHTYERGDPNASYKVEGAKTSTPSKTNTYKCLPIANTLRP